MKLAKKLFVALSLAILAGAFFMGGIFLSAQVQQPEMRLERLERIFNSTPAKKEPLSGHLDGRVSRLEMEVFRLESALRWLAMDVDQLEGNLKSVEARVAALENKK